MEAILRNEKKKTTKPNLDIKKKKHKFSKSIQLFRVLGEAGWQGGHWANTQVAWVYFQLRQKPCELGQCCLTTRWWGEGAAAATSLLFCDSATRYPRGFPPKAKELGIFVFKSTNWPPNPNSHVTRATCIIWIRRGAGHSGKGSAADLRCSIMHASWSYALRSYALALRGKTAHYHSNSIHLNLSSSPMEETN